MSTWSDAWCGSQNYLKCSIWVLFYYYFFWKRLTWLCLDGFEGRGGAAESRILSRFLLITSMQDWTYFVFHLIWIEFMLIPFWVQLNNNEKCHGSGSGSGVRSKWGCIKVGRLGTRLSLIKWQFELCLLLPPPPNVKEVMFSPLSVCLSVCSISQKVVDRSRWNFVDRLSVWQGRTD